MIHTRLFILGLSLLSLTSCSDNPFVFPGMGTHAQPPELEKRQKIAHARGINTQLLDNKVDVLKSEAIQIQHQVNGLLEELANIEDKIKKLSDQSKMSAGSKTTMLKPSQIDFDKKQALKAKKTYKKQTIPSGTNGVYNLRIGQHKDKTRLVMDVVGSTEHTHDFDNDLGILTVTLPKTLWSIKQNKTYKLQQFSGYQAKEGKGGTIIAFAVPNTKTIKTMRLNAGKGQAARIVIDLMK